MDNTNVPEMEQALPAEFHGLENSPMKKPSLLFLLVSLMALNGSKYKLFPFFFLSFNYYYYYTHFNSNTTIWGLLLAYKSLVFNPFHFIHKSIKIVFTNLNNVSIFIIFLCLIFIYVSNVTFLSPLGTFLTHFPFVWVRNCYIK